MSELKPYRVFWSKAYYTNGEVVVLAKSPEDADNVVYDRMGDFEGSLDYYPDDDVIDVQEMDAKELQEFKGEVIKSL